MFKLQIQQQKQTSKNQNNHDVEMALRSGQNEELLANNPGIKAETQDEDSKLFLASNGTGRPLLGNHKRFESNWDAKLLNINQF